MSDVCLRRNIHLVDGIQITTENNRQSEEEDEKYQCVTISRFSDRKYLVNLLQYPIHFRLFIDEEEEDEQFCFFFCSEKHLCISCYRQTPFWALSRCVCDEEKRETEKSIWLSSCPFNSDIYLLKFSPFFPSFLSVRHRRSCQSWADRKKGNKKIHFIRRESICYLLSIVNILRLCDLTTFDGSFLFAFNIDYVCEQFCLENPKAKQWRAAESLKIISVCLVLRDINEPALNRTQS